MRRNDRPWWRRLLTPPPLDVAERLAWHYAAEIRLMHGLAQNAESLARYPHPQIRVLDAAERARERAQRLRRALEGLGLPVTEPTTGTEARSSGVWERLRASVSELSSMSEACLADAHAMEREHPGIAGLLYEFHREIAEDRRELIWTLAQLGETAVNTTFLETVAA